jgi:hypothetical protein
MVGAQLVNNLKAIQPGHGNVDDRNIGHGIVDLLYGFAAISRLCNYHHVAGFFNKSAKTGSKNGMIICQKNLDQSTAPLSTDSPKNTVVPAPG